MLNYKLIISIIIIIIIVSTYFFIFPGIFVIKASDLAGYWSDTLGNVYNINLINGKLKKITISHGDNTINGTINGTIFGCNVNLNNHMGKYYAKNRSIIFDDNIWYKQ